MRACKALGPDEEISGLMETVSVNNTLKEIEGTIEWDLSEDQMILVSSVEEDD